MTYKRLNRYKNTVRHIPLRMIAARVTFLLKKNARSVVRLAVASRVKTATVQGWLKCNIVPFKTTLENRFRQRAGRQDLGLNARSIMCGDYKFLSQTVHSPEPPWDADMPKLWRYHLHYLDLLLDLQIDGQLLHDLGMCRRSCDVLASWMESNPILKGVGWEPYPLSMRLINLILHTCLTVTETSPSAPLLETIYQHALCLEYYLEKHLEGNHLLKNAKALIFAGHFFNGPDAERWISRGMKVLDDELSKQVLKDGTYCERTPMYHNIVLDDMLEISAVLRESCLELPSFLSHAIRLMLSVAYELRHPDGVYPLFHDSTRDGAKCYGELQSFAETIGLGSHNQEGSGRLHVLPLGGFAVVRPNQASAQTVALVDMGAPGPKRNPGHMHASALSYELSICGHRIIVDPGVFEYQGALRNVYRSTRKHNTVALNGKDQSEVWASFRVGHRASVDIVQSFDTVDFVGVHLTVSDYFQCPECSHHRVIGFTSSGHFLVLDVVEGATLATSNIQLHSGVSVFKVSDDMIKCEVGEQRFCVKAANNMRWHHSMGSWISENFGEQQHAEAYYLQTASQRPTAVGYAVFAGEPQSELSINYAAGLLRARLLNNGQSSVELLFSVTAGRGEQA